MTDSKRFQRFLKKRQIDFSVPQIVMNREKMKNSIECSLKLREHSKIKKPITQFWIILVRIDTDCEPNRAVKLLFFSPCQKQLKS